MKNFALILSGCGQHDGSETHEVILTLLSMSQENITWESFAPDIYQERVVDHLTNQIEQDQKRSVLKESARLVRGKISPLNELDVSKFDAIIFPGGFGSVSTLCNWAHQSLDFEIHSDVKKILDQATLVRKPLGFICIAPILATKIYKSAKITIGNDKNIAQQIHDLGAQHIECTANEVVIDKENKIVSTPANMVANNINEVYEGIRRLVKELVLLS